MPHASPLALDITQEAAISQLLPRPPLLSSDRMGWDNIYFQYHRQPAWQTPEACAARHVIAISHFQQPTLTEQQLDGCSQSQRIYSGFVAIIPAQVSYQASWDREVDFSLLFVEPTHFTQIASDLIDADFEIMPRFATLNYPICHLALLLKSELKSCQLGSRLYVDSLFTAILVRLIRRYITKKLEVQNHTPGLTKGKLQQAVEYIHENLAENLSLDDIATAIGISPNYFTSCFKQSMGLSAYRYVIRCRIDKAKQLLIKSDLSVVEVSQQVGFVSQSHFTKAFRQYTGTTPKAYRRNK